MLNKYKIVGDVLIVFNRKDNREILFDAEDFDLVNKHTWRICVDKKKTYSWVSTKIKQIDKIASRLLMNAPAGMLVDHKNGDTLDNRKSNLRIATYQINNHNVHSAKGYTWNKAANKWQAQIAINRKPMYLGLYNTEAEARAAYLKAKKKYHPTAPHHLYQ